MFETEGWQAARLIPTSGITGPDEAERRATSALLAVMGAVREFGTAIVRHIGAPSGALETFIEVPFTLADGRSCIPDGALSVTRGKTAWLALVEVKTGQSDLEREQVESYLDAAREQGFDAVLTISNQLAPAPGVHPTDTDRRKTKKVALHHLSWAEILTLAVQIRVHQGVSDPDQAWILGELIRYLEHPRSGALDFTDMGSSWVPVRDSVAAGTLRPNDDGVSEVASRWDQLLRFSALRLGRELGADVQMVLPRKEAAEPAARLARFAGELAEHGRLSGALRIPDTIGPIEVDVDLRSMTVTVSVEIDAPREGRPATRVNWLVRQLSEAPDQLRVDGLLVGTRATTSELLGLLRENPAALVDQQSRDFKAFRVVASSSLGSKRGTGRGSFIDSVLAAVDGFYEGIVQVVRPWTPKAPQLPSGGRTAAEEAGIDTTPPTEDDASSLLDAEPSTETAPLPDQFADEVEAETAEIDWSAATPPPFVPSPEMVSWHRAEDRLERERSGEEPEAHD